MNKSFVAPYGVEWLLTAGGHWMNAKNPKEVITDEELRNRYSFLNGEEEKPRYIASPYSYYGDSSRPRSWSVWDTKEKAWTGDFVGDKEGAQHMADDLNYKYFECPKCDLVQVENATSDEVKCDRCGEIYYPA